MDKNCDKSSDGRHEVNWEKASYRRHAGTRAAIFDLVCLHCGSLGEITVEDDDVVWD